MKEEGIFDIILVTINNFKYVRMANILQYFDLLAIPIDKSGYLLDTQFGIIPTNSCINRCKLSLIDDPP